MVSPRIALRLTKGAGSRAAGLTMAFKLLEAAQRTWRRLDAHDLHPLIRVGVVLKDWPRWNERTNDQRRTPEGSSLDRTYPQRLTTLLFIV